MIDPFYRKLELFKFKCFVLAMLCGAALVIVIGVPLVFLFEALDVAAPLLSWVVSGSLLFSAGYLAGHTLGMHLWKDDL